MLSISIYYEYLLSAVLHVCMHTIFWWLLLLESVCPCPTVFCERSFPDPGLAEGHCAFLLLFLQLVK